MRFSPRNTSRGSWAQASTDCTATLIIEAIKAAGTPCPVTSATRNPLTSPQQDGVAFEPSSCPNGRYVVFSIGGHGGAKTRTIWRMEAAGGGNLKQLSDGKNDLYSVCSSDGKWVYYSDLSSGAKLSRVSIDGGKSEKLTELPVYTSFDISPDGTLAAFTTFAPTSSPKKQLALLPVDSPQNMKLLDLQRPSLGAVRFTHRTLAPDTQDSSSVS